MKIEPPVAAGMPDYSEESDQQSGEQRKGSQHQKADCKPMVPHGSNTSETVRDLKSRKASRRKEKSKRRRKIAERKARQERSNEE
ncbi:hypothetical protein EOPP23_09825 [Endozoicomonas sp. OPT23]|uniref:hypothetical protein n=1 Tax=Endozoicomonas sp. OPT23 TaxID=2072845 RepID=UPI00129BA4E5|nr:hypothetical protein [Endozoicomonas sp. OPT23]MRI33280.1 hypothetical protein [Endozoicomonas sp. OPT23]